MKQVMAKGVNFLYSKRFVESKYGTETWQQVIASLPQQAQEIWGSAILVNQEYPFSAYKEMITALTAKLASAKDTEIASIYEYVADQSLEKIYKIFFHFTNPSFVIKNYPKLWDKFFNAGKVEVSVAEKGHAILKFILPSVFLDWLTPACLGYSKKAVEMAGGKNLTLNRKNIRQLPGDSWEITYELRWNE
jgi:hypothetical protein